MNNNTQPENKTFVISWANSVDTSTPSANDYEQIPKYVVHKNVGTATKDNLSQETLEEIVQKCVTKHILLFSDERNISQKCAVLEAEYKNLDRRLSELKNDDIKEIRNSIKEINNEEKLSQRLRKESNKFWLMFVVTLIGVIFTCVSSIKSCSNDKAIEKINSTLQQSVKLNRPL